jgi:hypothetical protein
VHCKRQKVRTSEETQAESQLFYNALHKAKKVSSAPSLRGTQRRCGIAFAHDAARVQAAFHFLTAAAGAHDTTCPDPTRASRAVASGVKRSPVTGPRHPSSFSSAW